jgi:hypothetical protein
VVLFRVRDGRGKVRLSVEVSYNVLTTNGTMKAGTAAEFLGSVKP